MTKKKLPQSGDCPERHRPQGPKTTTSNANTPKSPNTAAAPEPDLAPPVSRAGPRERAIVEEIVEALHDIDIDALPETSRGDTVRGLLWALEALITPLVEPHDQHYVPFNIRLTQDEAAVGRAAINEVWQISSSLLTGLHFLRTRGYVSRWGAEVPAMWSPGDFYSAIEGARDALARLEALNDKLHVLKFGTALTDAAPV